MKKTRSLLAAVLTLCLLFCQAVPAFAADTTDWFLVRHPEPLFNPLTEGSRPATVEEFVAYVIVKSYEATGTDHTPVADKNGKYPSSWCAKYIQDEVEKDRLDPQLYAYQQPATIAFAADYLSRTKGQYPYNYENEYAFSNTDSLTAEQQMLLNVAAQNNLIPYTSNMDAMQTIPRSSMNNYLLPTGNLPVVPEPTITPDGGMKELHVYFTDSSSGNALTDPAEELALLKKNKDNITMVSFHNCNISDHGPTEGNQFLNYNLERHPAVVEAIDFCNQNGIIPLFSIANFGKSGYDSATIVNMLSSDSNINTCISEILAATLKYNFKGVNIGFEFVDVNSREQYTKFLNKLRTSLNAHGLLLMNTIGAYFQQETEDTSFYDYKTIGELSDYVHIILYDDHSDTAYNYWKVTPGAMSNIVYIDRVLKYAMHRIPAGKILLGMSSFAIDYNITTHHAQDVTRQSVLSLAPGGVINDDPEPTLGGTFNYTASDGQHTVYLETDAGIKTRLLRTYRYGLCGASMFHLASEHEAFLQNTAAFSTNKIEVMNAVRAGLVPNSRRNNYKNPATRAEFCDLIVALITSKSGKDIDTFLAEKGVSRSAGRFSDTNAENVLSVAALGIVNGREDGTFAPTAAITRQEAAAMLARLATCMGYSGGGTGLTFNDTSNLGSWAKDSIATVSSIVDPTNNKRVMNGTGHDNFSPFNVYTREQSYMTAIRLYHALQ